MLYLYKKTGELLEVVSQHGEGIKMCQNAEEEVIYADEEDLVPQIDATNEKIRTEERLTAELKAEGADPDDGIDCAALAP